MNSKIDLGRSCLPLLPASENVNYDAGSCDSDDGNKGSEEEKNRFEMCGGKFLERTMGRYAEYTFLFLWPWIFETKRLSILAEFSKRYERYCFSLLVLVGSVWGALSGDMSVYSDRSSAMSTSQMNRPSTLTLPLNTTAELPSLPNYHR